MFFLIENEFTETKKKIRLGLILQECVRLALHTTKYNTFVPTPNYDEDCMVPDFIIPSLDNPKFFIEVTQSEARDSFRMKLLRYFESVCEAKVILGKSVIGVNILMGDPETQLPKNNIKALCSFFDVNLIPRNQCVHAEDKQLLANLEEASLQLSSDINVADVSTAVSRLKDKHDQAIRVLGKMIQNILDHASLKKNLFSLWKIEKDRLEKMTPAIPITQAQPIKKPIMKSLFLEEQEYKTLCENLDHFDRNPLPLKRKLNGLGFVKLPKQDERNMYSIFALSLEDLQKVQGVLDPEDLPKPLLKKLQQNGYVKECKGISIGTKQAISYEYGAMFEKVFVRLSNVELSSDDTDLLKSGVGLRLQQLCSQKLDDRGPLWFFQDIRNEMRRKQMIDFFLTYAMRNKSDLFSSLKESFFDNTFAGIEHNRCWIADLVPLAVGRSHNYFNGSLFRHRDYPLTLGNPYPNLVIKSPRFGRDKDNIEKVFSLIVDIFFAEKATRGVLNHRDLEKVFLKFRVDAAIKLQKLNPLHLFIENICEIHHLKYEYLSCDNLLSDLLGENNAQSKFQVIRILTNDGNTTLVNALYVDKYGGLDKAKEWSARGRAFLYRVENGHIARSNYKKMIFILDGPWKNQGISKLQRAGWLVTTIQDFEKILLSESYDA